MQTMLFQSRVYFSYEDELTRLASIFLINLSSICDLPTEFVFINSKSSFLSHSLALVKACLFHVKYVLSLRNDNCQELLKAGNCLQ